MTTAFFPGSPASASKQVSSVSKPAVKPVPSTAAAVAAYPWLTAAIRRNMSARAVRLMRADY